MKGPSKGIDVRQERAWMKAWVVRRTTGGGKVSTARKKESRLTERGQASWLDRGVEGHDDSVCERTRGREGRRSAG